MDTVWLCLVLAGPGLESRVNEAIDLGAGSAGPHGGCFGQFEAPPLTPPNDS